MAKQAALSALVDAYYNRLRRAFESNTRHTKGPSAKRSKTFSPIPPAASVDPDSRTYRQVIRPDGTLKDPMGLVRGHWEAKDTADDLDVEIAKNITKGYPLGNIIFEDTRPAVLYPEQDRGHTIDLRDREQLADSPGASSPTSSRRSRPSRSRRRVQGARPRPGQAA